MTAIWSPAARHRYNQAHRQEITDYQREYQQRPHAKVKRQAREAVKYALKTGRLVRGECEQKHRGDCEGRIEAHHDDYSKPLQVRWLCRAHHTEADRRA